MYYTPTGTAGTNDYFDITGVQLEIGSVATPFARAGGTLQGELSACMRYYYRANGAGPSAFQALGNAYSTSGVQCAFQAPTTMRTYPTVIDYSGIRLTDNVSVFTVSSLTLSSDYGTNNLINLIATGATGLTQFRSYLLVGNAAGNYIGVSAEL
jgi:hypothetical protein